MAASSPFKPGLFSGKAAIVTGGGTGIGLCVTHRLIHLGCNVLICSRSEAKLAAAAEKLAQAARSEEKGGRLEWRACNVRDEEQVQAMVADAIRLFGRLDLVVNNGGGQFVAPAAAISANGFRAVVDTNLTGTFLVCREAFVQHMREHGGAIVNISMVHGQGVPRMAHSGAARAGTESLTRSLAREWACRGVRVNALAPGIVFTESGFANYGDLGPSYVRSVLPHLPARRLGTEEETADAIIFLLSDAAAYITGEVVRVDGGLGLVSYPDPLAGAVDGEEGPSRFPVHGRLPPFARL